VLVSSSATSVVVRLLSGICLLLSSFIIGACICEPFVNLFCYVR
jgi:hypothetical protein